MPRPIVSTLALATTFALGAAGGAWALRQLERDRLVIRAIHPEAPPRVEYRLTPLGRGLGKAVCGVWSWAARHLGDVQRARRAYDAAALTG